MARCFEVRDDNQYFVMKVDPSPWTHYIAMLRRNKRRNTDRVERNEIISKKVKGTAAWNGLTMIFTNTMCNKKYIK